MKGIDTVEGIDFEKDLEQVTIPAQAFRCVTRSGFLKDYWALLARLRKLEPLVTMEAVFDYLNKQYEKTFGVTRYPSYDAFRVARDRTR